MGIWLLSPGQCELTATGHIELNNSPLLGHRLFHSLQVKSRSWHLRFVAIAGAGEYINTQLIHSTSSITKQQNFHSETAIVASCYDDLFLSLKSLNVNSRPELCLRLHVSWAEHCQLTATSSIRVRGHVSASSITNRGTLFHPLSLPIILAGMSANSHLTLEKAAYLPVASIYTPPRLTCSTG